MLFLHFSWRSCHLPSRCYRLDQFTPANPLAYNTDPMGYYVIQYNIPARPFPLGWAITGAGSRSSSDVWCAPHFEYYFVLIKALSRQVWSLGYLAGFSQVWLILKKKMQQIPCLFSLTEKWAHWGPERGQVKSSWNLFPRCTTVRKSQQILWLF